jgi:hypothetical protein
MAVNYHCKKFCKIATNLINSMMMMGSIPDHPCLLQKEQQNGENETFFSHFY